MSREVDPFIATAPGGHRADLRRLGGWSRGPRTERRLAAGPFPVSTHEVGPAGFGLPKGPILLRAKGEERIS